jgi:hypothetical protein
VLGLYFKKYCPLGGGDIRRRLWREKIQKGEKKKETVKEKGKKMKDKTERAVGVSYTEALL